jgi:hypothetical protein
LQKLILQEEQEEGAPIEQQLFNKLKDKPFWIPDIQKHKQIHKQSKGNCCFNHIIGMPCKDNREHPIYDYENLVYDTLFSINNSIKDKHLYILKSTGLGISELCLRLIVWLCTKKDTARGHYCIVTGPNIDLSTKLMTRIRYMLLPHGIIPDTKQTLIELNNNIIECFPSYNLDAMRGLTNVRVVYLDEADFFPPHQQQNAIDICSRYIAKGDPYLIMTSTPAEPGSLFERIQQEPEDTCIWHRLYLDFQYGLDKIYTREEIERARASPSFEREYCLKFMGLTGNFVSHKLIQEAIEKGSKYDPNKINQFCAKSIGIDPSYGSSNFAIVVTQFVSGQIQILYAEEFARPDLNDMLSLVNQLTERYYPVNKILVDGSNPEFIQPLKRQLKEDPDYDKVIDRYTKMKYDYRQVMKVIPVNFSTEHKTLLSHTKMLLEKGFIAINPVFDKLIVSLKTAQADEFKLDKKNTAFDDTFDAFRLALSYYTIR